MRSVLLYRAVLVAGCFAVCAPAVAHHSPNEVIEALSLAIERDGATPRMLVQRAYEYRALDDADSARRDLEEALALHPGHLGALKALARMDINEGAPAAAVARLRQCLDRGLDVNAAGPVHALWAEALESAGDEDAALRQCRLALRAARPDIDWFVQEARLLRELGRMDDAVAALQGATERNPSAVLHRAWIEALIDAGNLAQASSAVEAELASSRWRSGWLLIRARMHESSGKHALARRDAHAALREIEDRLNPAYPDPFLLIEAGSAHAILGEFDRAGIRLDQARALGMPRTLTARLEERLRHSEDQRAAAP